MNLLQPQMRVANTVSWFKSAAILIVTMLLSSCAWYSGYGLKPGVATEPQVREAMGQPAATWSTPAGEVWAYPRGPLGTETFLVRFDENGKLAEIQQVLRDERFDQIYAGMTRDDVLHLIGPPFQTTTFSGTDQTAWDYHYRDDSAQSALFSVMFNNSGVVVWTFKQRLVGDGHEH